MWQPLIIWAARRAGIAFITQPNEMAEADYPRDGGKEASWIPVCGEGEGEVGVGGRGPRQAVLPKQDCKQVCVCACVETVPQKGGGSGGAVGGGCFSPIFQTRLPGDAYE